MLDITTGTNISFQKRYTRTAALVFAPDGKGLYSIDVRGGVDFYDLATLTLVRTDPLPADIECGDIDFHGNRLCVGRYGDLLLFAMGSLEQVGLHQDTSTSITQAVFLANGRRIVTLSEDGFLRFYRDVADPTWDRPPVIDIDSPTWGQEVADDLVIAGTIMDDEGSVDGSYRLNGGPWIPIETPEAWNFTVGRESLVQGGNQLTVLANDGAHEVEETVLFRFVGEPRSNQRPTVRILAPAEGSMVGDVIIINGTAHDDVEVKVVSVQLADGPWLGATGTEEWYYVTPIPSTPEGWFSVRAKAWDDSLESTVAEIRIFANRSTTTLNRPPIIHLERPKVGALITDTLSCMGSTEDDGFSILTLVAFDEGSWSVLSTATAWDIEFPTDGWSLGPHTISLVAFDGETTSAQVDVEVVKRATGAPSITILSPLPGQRFSDTITISGFASSPLGPIQRIELRVDDGPWMTAAANETWNFELGHEGLGYGEITVQARAWDVQTNSSIASIIIYHEGKEPRAGEDGSWPAWMALFVISGIVGLLLWIMKRRRATSVHPTPMFLAIVLTIVLLLPVGAVGEGGSLGDEVYDYEVVKEVAGIRGACHMFLSPDMGNVCIINRTYDINTSNLVRIYNLTANRFIAEAWLSGFDVQDGCWVDDRILLAAYPVGPKDAPVAPIYVLSSRDLSILSLERPLPDDAGNDVYFSQLEISPSGEYIAAARTNLVTFRTSDFSVVHYIDEDFTDYIRSVAWSRDEKSIALLSDNVWIFDLVNGTNKKSITNYGLVPQGIFWSPEGDRVCVINAWDIAFIDAKTLEEVSTDFFMDGLRCWDHRDQPFELLWGSDTNLGIITLPSLSRVVTLRAANKGVYEVIWDPDAHRIVTMTREGVMRVFIEKDRSELPSPPRIEIWKPLEGAIVASDIVAEGTVTDDEQLLYARYKLNDDTWSDLDNPLRWKINITLAAMVEGDNTLSISASDGESLSIKSVTFRVDPRALNNAPPSIRIVSPAENERVGRVVEVTGEAADDHGVQMVIVRAGEGVWSLAKGTGEWSATLAMPSSFQQGNITIEARSWDGLSFSETDNVSVSLEAESLPPNGRPRVIINSPSEGMVVYNEVTIAGRTEDDSERLTTFVTIDGGPLKALSTGLAWTTGPLRLGFGNHSATAIAFDGSSLSVAVTVNFTLVMDIPMRVVITSPENGTLVPDELLVCGVVLGGHEMIGPVQIFIDGKPLSALGGGRSWEVLLDMTEEEPGEHLIMVRATDGLGSTGSANVTITIASEDDGSHEPPEQDLTYLGLLVVVVVILLAIVWYSRRKS